MSSPSPAPRPRPGAPTPSAAGGHLRWGRGVVAFGMLALVIALVVSSVSVLNEESTPQPVDRAFSRAMVEQLRAVDADVVRRGERSRRAQLRELAVEVRVTQAREIAELTSANVRLARLGQPPGDVDRFPGGDARSADATAGPSEQQVLDRLIRANSITIEIARVQLADGTDPALLRIAEDISRSRAAQIRRAERWRRDWGGA